MGSTGEVETMTVKPICFSESSKTMNLRPPRIVRGDPGIKVTSASSTEALTQEVTSEKIMGSPGEVKNMTMKPVCFSEINKMINLRPLKIVRGDPGIKLASTSSNKILIQEASSEKLMGSTTEADITTVKPAGFREINTKLGLRPLRIKRNNSGIKTTSSGSDEVLIQEASSSKHWVNENLKLETSPFKNMNLNDMEPAESCSTKITASDTLPQLYAKMWLPELPSSGPMSELDAAALKLQKVYKSYRTRRNLADCAVAIEELWWKALDFASLKRCSISFFNSEKPESPSSRWARARTRAAKVGKGLSKNEKAQKLALQHWLEAIDPRHRYGHNLHFYYAVWFRSESTHPFFYWLDIGDGKEVNLEKCPRTVLQYQCVVYLGQNERKAYEVIFDNGKLVYKLSRMLVSTIEGSKSIFVLSTSRAMYVGQKKKGRFQHSSFLSGGVTIAAGRLIVKEGILKAVWPYSGHYLPTQENFKEFINFLVENDVDLTDVRTRSVHDDECPSDKKHGKNAGDFFENEMDDSPKASSRGMFDMDNGPDETTFEPFGNASSKWTTGVGPRIGCLRDYPTDLQFMALEQFNVPATDELPPTGTKAPIPLRRSGSELRLSPVLANLGFNSSAVSHTLPRPKRPIFVPKCSSLSKLSGFEVATQ